MGPDRGERAAARGRAAGERAAELKTRRKRLEQGDPVTEQDVSDAHDAAATSKEHDVQSSLDAAEGHRVAARAHRQAADTLEQTGDREKAVRHRELADVDDEGARDDDRTAVREAQQ